MNIGLLGLLTLIFVTLKLTGFIAWSWLWVVSPLWIGFVLLILFIVGQFTFVIWLHHRNRPTGRK